MIKNRDGDLSFIPHYWYKEQKQRLFFSLFHSMDAARIPFRLKEEQLRKRSFLIVPLGILGQTAQGFTVKIIISIISNLFLIIDIIYKVNLPSVGGLFFPH